MKRKPFYSPCVINKNHAHAENLVAAFLLNENTGNSCRDLLQDENDMSLTEDLFTYDGIEVNSINNYGLIANTGNEVVNSEAGTIIMSIKFNSIFNNGASNQLIGGSGNIRTTSGALLLLKNSDNTMYFFLRDSSNHYSTYKTGQFPNWMTGQQIAMQWDRANIISYGSNLSLNLDGVDLSPFNTVSATSWNSYTVDPLCVLNDLVALNFQANAVLEYLYIYNKVLSSETIKSIYQDPYAMVYKPNYLSNFIGAYAPLPLPTTMDKRHKHFGANALPIGIGL